jgi:hypothetical protein
MAGTSSSAPRVFISYSHKDEEWKDRLQTHLNVLGVEGLLDVWEDRQISAGDDWYKEIKSAIERTDVVVFLISANFLTSPFIRDEEVGRFLEMRQQKGLRVIPILLKPCPWRKVKWAAKIQMRPSDGREITADTDHQIDRDFAKVAEEIHDLVSVRKRLREPNTGSTSTPRIDLTRLPAVCEHLLGREKELAQLDEAWTDPSRNIISLVACGGVGKSVLTKHWLDRVAGDGFRGAEVVYAWSFIARERTVARGRRMSFLLPRLAGLGRMSLRR